jgi:hypothetical protein
MSESRFLGKKVLQLKDQLHVLETSESEEAYFKRRSNATLKMRQDQMRTAKNQAFDTCRCS